MKHDIRNSEFTDSQIRTDLIRSRYDRIAPYYNAMEFLMEFHFRKWRADLWKSVPPGRILEVGVGTGKNIPFYPDGNELTGIDFSPKMLEQARLVAKRTGKEVSLHLADVQALSFESNSFDTVVTSCVFCSVPDPTQGLREIYRVLKPGGKLVMLEHVLSQRPLLRTLMNWLDFIPYRLWGAHINRHTVDTVHQVGFPEIQVRDLSLDIVKLIEATA